MAHVAQLGNYVLQGVTTAQIVAGQAVTIAASGARMDLPSVAPAAENAVVNVFVAIVPPDEFSRPTPADMYTASYYSVSDVRNATLDEFAKDTKTYYKVSPRVYKNFVIPSGWLVQLHKGGVYAIGPDAYISSTTIKTVGTFIGVGANGKWKSLANATGAVGVVRDYRASDDYLLIAVF